MYLNEKEKINKLYQSVFSYHGYISNGDILPLKFEDNF